jgi:Ca2+-binding RTX toxin-like protein
MGYVTIRGGAGAPDQVINFTDSAGLALATAIAGEVNSHPAINVKLYANGGSQVAAASYGALVVDGKKTVTIEAAAGTRNQSVVAGIGGVRYSETAGESLWLAGAGADTIYAGTSTVSGNTLFAAGKGDRIFLGAGAVSVTETGTNAAIKAAGGRAVITDSGTNNTVTGGSGAETIYGGRQGNYDLGSGAALLVNTVKGGTETVRGNAKGTETVLGGTADVIIAGASKLVFFGEGTGSATVSGAGADSLVGGGNNSSITFSGTGNAEMVSGVGNQTLTGAAATGNLTLFGGPGDNVLIGGTGNDAFVVGSGFETLTGGGGANSYVFTSTGTTSRVDVITDFNPAKDSVGLYGYGSEPGADQAALDSATTSGGVTTISLTDGTKVEFLGAPVLQSSDFF